MIFMYIIYRVCAQLHTLLQALLLVFCFLWLLTTHIRTRFDLYSILTLTPSLSLSLLLSLSSKASVWFVVVVVVVVDVSDVVDVVDVDVDRCRWPKHSVELNAVSNTRWKCRWNRVATQRQRQQRQRQ